MIEADIKTGVYYSDFLNFEQKYFHEKKSRRFREKSFLFSVLLNFLVSNALSFAKDKILW